MSNVFFRAAACAVLLGLSHVALAHEPPVSSVNDALGPLINMGQQLLEPPDVNGWELGRGWFSSGAMLARMNFAAQIAANQRFNLRDALRGVVQSADDVVAQAMDRLTPPEYSGGAYDALVEYAHAGAQWTGSDAQITAKASGLVHLIVGSGDYQFI